MKKQSSSKLYRSATLAGAAVGAALIPCTNLVATPTDPLAGLSADAGWDGLLSSGARRAFGSGGWRVGVGYQAPAITGTDAINLQLDYSSHGNSTHHLRSIGLWGSARWELVKDGPLVPYVGLGVGVQRHSARRVDSVTTPHTVTETHTVSTPGSGGYGPPVITTVTTTSTTQVTSLVPRSSTRLAPAARATLGLGIGGGAYVEVAGHVSSSVLGEQTLGASASAGYRF